METEKEIRWAAFVESTVANFLVDNKMEKMTIEDGNGNKVKLTRQKDNSIKVESASTAVL
jgi:hypothetical protein